MVETHLPFMSAEESTYRMISSFFLGRHFARRAGQSADPERDVDDLIFSITPDASVRWAKLQKGECHVMPYPNPADLDAMRRTASIQVLEQPGLNIGYLAYNTTKKPLDDVRVRRALNMAINKKAIIDGVYLSTGVAAKNPIPPSFRPGPASWAWRSF